MTRQTALSLAVFAIFVLGWVATAVAQAWLS